MAKKPKPKPCTQKPTKDFAGCPFWRSCKYSHDSNVCRMTFGDEGDDIEVID